MTAIVAVLNKHAVAVAADSAVTMGNTHKVVNSANKIFTLSKYNPVAVMTYNNAAFMGTPWDIIIKEYRKQLKSICFSKLSEYVDDFVQYLHKRHFFCDAKTQLDNLEPLFVDFLERLYNEIAYERNIDKADITEQFVNEKIQACMSILKSQKKCTDFNNYENNEFLNFFESTIIKHIQNKRLLRYDLLAEAFFYYVGLAMRTANYSGLVFVGYGEDEIYPSLKQLNISFGFDRYLKSFEEEVCSIEEHGTSAAIIPFAQVDVTQTIIRGIHPSFQDIISKVTEKSINSVIEKITKILDTTPENEALSTAVKSLDISSVLKATSLQIVKAMQTRYTDPLLNTVVSLDKEDMANMAESFISLTSLVRRMQPGEETVGGPVDVAVISKGDGFVWINRKHYFKPELNATFFSNYFK